ncbi:MAG: gamma-glutamyltransferase [Gammaproteobacteria bacterium]|nr:gamma-glutamyltransferase [Pseudomonadales bacterium]MCP5347848.1 gamma-glutamyltransferase [Pseudomonadales bacterium]
MKAPSVVLLLTVLLTGCSESTDSTATSTSSAPTAGTGQPSEAALTRDEPARGDWDLGFMAAVANPYATEAAAEMLAQGGHAVDAAIAAHAVLGLVEPESSGLGGGGFMLVYERDSGEVSFLDGRETAPAGATIDMFMSDGEPMNFLDAWQSGKAVGVPGTVALYRLAHDRYGILPWETVFEPAIRLATEGFVVTEKMARSLPRMASMSRLDENPGAAEYFYPNGQPVQAGQLLRNPEYAATLRRIAAEGPAAFYSGDIAEAIAEAAQAEPNGGSLTVEDIAAYQPEVRQAVCGDWRDLTVCSATPPSSGAMQIMVPNLYDRLVPDDADLGDRIRAFVDAQRLAYADRDYYFGDPDRVDVPVEQLLDPRYLEYRAANPTPPEADPVHGDPAAVLGGEPLAAFAEDSTLEPAGTSHFSIVDNYGNAVSATMTVESAFGSGRWAAGFLLNNEMTDFSRDYHADLPEAANAVRPGARPRSSMSPTILLDSEGDLYMVTGSPGGNSIPAYTAKTILGIVDWGLSVQDAVDFPNIIARGETVRVEIGREPGSELAEQLQQAGYNVQESAGENSGLHVILVGEDGLIGAADPRREGTVMTTAPL